MALKKLVSNLEDFFKDNPYQAKYKTKAGPVVAMKSGFNQRNIPFGKDKPGNGNSGQPFLVKKLPEVNSDPSVETPDFILRKPEQFLDTRKDDLERISKFLLSTQGVLFIAKQELLSLQNPQVPGRPNRSRLFNGLYNPAMTLAQVAGQGTGLHIEKQGLLPIFDNRSKFETVYKTEYSSVSTNRLTLLYASKITGSITQAEVANGRDLGVSRDENTILSYTGGADSYGLGRTRIPFAGDRVYSSGNKSKQQTAFTTAQNKVKTTPANNAKGYGVTTQGLQLGYFTGQPVEKNSVLYNQWNQNNNSTDVEGKKTYNNTVYLTGNTFPDTNPAVTNQLNVFVFRQRDYQNPGRPIIGKDGSATIQDFRKIILEDPTQVGTRGPATTQMYATDYQSATVNREQRVNTGNPGKRTRNRSSLVSYDNDTVDKINMIPLYTGTTVLDPYGVAKDFVKFRFEVIDNTTPSLLTFVHFRAFLSNIKDGFTSDWESTKFIGRGEKFYNYTGFNRSISFSFKVHAQSRAEMRSIYQKLNYLATTLAPDYKNGYMKGNLVRVTIGGYIYKIPGFISSLTYAIPEDASWETALKLNGEIDDTVLETPTLLDVDVNFTPIHDFVPQISPNKANALITPSTGRNPYLEESKIHNFNTQYNPTSGKYTFNNLEQQGIDSITAANLYKYATKGAEKTPPTALIKVADNALGEKIIDPVEVTAPGINVNTTAPTFLDLAPF